MNIKWVEWTALWMPSVLLINITEISQFFVTNAWGGAARHRASSTVLKAQIKWRRGMCLCEF